ncbi:MAG: hypothetical protein EPN31_12170 [Castellaniella sp.]|uniref:hypothetical protein n=1 Tax=Castellaniella sp. TaxID=1955812 RepID=UPI00121FF71C|nr:hypothetical protein [Castellaniella sp.]TAN27283.1 MAG: hypothetical protein EPN31_12170 [Castellaniella sp.]
MAKMNVARNSGNSEVDISMAVDIKPYRHIGKVHRLENAVDGISYVADQALKYIDKAAIDAAALVLADELLPPDGGSRRDRIMKILEEIKDVARSASMGVMYAEVGNGIVCRGKAVHRQHVEIGRH